MTKPKKDGSPRGFASMTPERRIEISRMGGKSVPPDKRSFSLDKNLAARAGYLGGKNVPAEKRTFSQDRTLAVEAGRKGGDTHRK
ncbi:MAG: stress-induced protein [Candidatus Adlerbacteria bacterium]|nr:stress-induced protein [Candidatus Adlerbacteria bacterium]